MSLLVVFPFSWTILVPVVTVLYLTFRFHGLWILETLASRILEIFNPGVLRQGKQISGPKWQYPNGSVIERFVNGRANSEKWQKYGPVYRLWSGHHPEIVITTPEDFKHFSSDANSHPKTPNVNLGWFVSQILGQAMGLLYGPDWKRLRKIFDPAFTHSAAVAKIDDIDASARKYVDNLPQLADGGSMANGKPRSFSLPVLKTFTKFPYFLTAKAIYGPMTENEERDLWDLTEKRIALNPYWIGGGPYRFETLAKWYDRGAVERLREFNAGWREYNARMVRTRRDNGEFAPIIEYWEEYEQGNMSMDELVHTLDELLMLNLDVITHVVTWFITLVADHEEAKQELRSEVAANKDNLLEYLAKTDTHLHRCFVESMRIRPFAIFTIGESSSVVKNFHGVFVKPNTQILVDVLAINVRNQFWGSDSEAFVPSRLKDIKPADLRHNLHSFGVGSRKCMGQYVAGHIVKSLVAHLFDKYEVVVMREQKGDESYDVVKNSWIPKSDSSLQLTERNEAVL